MFRNLFDVNKPFWMWVDRIPQIVVLSLCFYLCCIPIVTIIPAACALFDAISRCTVPNEKGCYSRFFKTFLRELKKGIPLTIFWLVIGFIAVYGDQLLILNAQNDPAIQVFSIIYRILILSIIAFLSWLIPLQSRYHHTFLHLHGNALSFFFGRLPDTFLMFIITALVLIISLAHPYMFILLVIAPGFIAILHSGIVEKAFRMAFPEDYVDWDKDN